MMLLHSIVTDPPDVVLLPPIVGLGQLVQSLPDAPAILAAITPEAHVSSEECQDVSLHHSTS